MTPLTDYVLAEIRAEMARQRLTQVRLAQLLGISQSRLSRMLSDGPLTIDCIAAIAGALDVPIAQLLGNPDEFRITPVSDEYAMLGAA